MTIGRFAPSPTGPLHFGSLVAAVASWLDARASQGTWRVRMEDLDRARARPEAADIILRQLESLGLQWDGSVVYQSARLDAYRAALERLRQSGQVYWCGCSRKEIADSAMRYEGKNASHPVSDRARIYPGTCREGLAAGKRPRAVRLRTGGEPVAFTDRLQGDIAQAVDQEIGDFVLFRADGLYAYQLAVVVDDADQGVTDVVRGADLLDSTPRQILLQRLLGLPTPRYLHVPVAVNGRGEKLSKQTRAPAVATDRPAEELRAALAFLGLRGAPPAASPSELLAWGRAHWSVLRLPARRALRWPPGPAA